MSTLSDILLNFSKYECPLEDCKYTIYNYSKELGYSPMFQVSNEFHGFLIMKQLQKVPYKFVMLEGASYA